MKKIFVITMMIIIFLFSNQKGTNSTSLTNSFIRTTIISLSPVKINEEKLDKIIKNIFVPIRKIAHFTIYFLLGISIINLISDYTIKNLILISILLSVSYALTDEIHQLFVVGRGGSLIDVLIDTLGASTGIFIYYKIKNRDII
ncbi:MAG: VanZ family protein [Bacilli bacterium]